MLNCVLSINSGQHGGQVRGEGHDTGYIKSYNLRYGVDNNVILSGWKPTGLYYSPMARSVEGMQ